jgi:TolB-like protein/DNA-binding winged helix-turn-helix (wHTH) protein
MNREAPSRDTVLMFESYRLDNRTGLSRQREGCRWEPIALGSRALAVLRALAERSGELVLKSALMDTVWPGIAVEENNLTVQISAVRRVLDESRADGSCIGTVTGRGYRFLPAVTAELGTGVAPEMDLPPAFGPAPMTDPAAAVLPFENFSIESEWERPVPTQLSAAPHPVARAPSIAVLPFDNFSLDHRWSRFCDGLVEDIITDLARRRELAVIARHSSFQYRNRLVDVREIGQRLGARYILEGSLQFESGSLKVTAQLIEAASGIHVWAQRYDREERDFFAVQQEIVAQIVSSLAGFRGTILRNELAKVRRRSERNLQTYELYLLGHDEQARFNRESTLRAIELCSAATAADPTFSRPWNVLGWSYSRAAYYGWINHSEGRAKTREAVLKAIELDPDDPLSLASLAHALANDGDNEGAKQAVERTLHAGANHSEAITMVAQYVTCVLDRNEEALELVDRSIRLNPHTPAWYYLHHVRAAFFATAFDRVPQYFERLLADPDTSSIPLHGQRLFNALALVQLDRMAEAHAALAELRELDPMLAAIAKERKTLSAKANSLFNEALGKLGIATH